MRTIEADGFESQNPRYKRIEEFNKKSFLMTEGSELQVIQSLHSAGAPRDVLTPALKDNFEDEVIRDAQRIGRRMLTGNMSPLGYGPDGMTREQRLEDAQSNASKFFHLNTIDPADVRMLRPERDYTTSLTILNLDEMDETSFTPDGTGLLTPDTQADMWYTFNPEIILAARPADCPIAFITAETPKGPVTVLLHLASLGVANGYIPQAKEMLNSLEVEWETARIQLTAGGHAESYNFTNFEDYDPREKFPEATGLYLNVHEVAGEDGKVRYDFDVDVAAEAYEQIVRVFGIDEYQIYLDTSDTSSPSSGYSSQTRSFKDYAVDGGISRDIVLARRTNKS
jgi:hypothetical protein